jgi:hypothetical protein
MQMPSWPDFEITSPRILTMPEMIYFHVTNQPTEFANLDRDLDILLADLYEAKKQANITEQAGPDIVRYYRASGESAPELFWMEVGIPAAPGTQPAGKALVKVLPPFDCAGLLMWGSLLAHVGPAYEKLTQAVEAGGLERTGENREWTYWFESVDSPNNLMGIFMGIQKGG